MAIPVTKRLGAADEVVSIRANVTEVLGSASPLCEMKTRPVLVAAQRVEVSDAALCTAAMAPPAQVPRLGSVSEVEPIVTQSPHSTAKSPVNSLQCLRNSVRFMEPIPWVLVR